MLTRKLNGVVLRNPIASVGVHLYSDPVLAAGAMLSIATSAHADMVYLRGFPDPLKDVTIEKVADGKIYFVTNGNPTNRDLEKLDRININNETALNAAETAFAGGKFDDAVAGYQKTLRSTTKDWLKDWAANRLVIAAGKTGRFDAAVSAWIATVQKDPVGAAKNKPTLPDAKSTYLDSAAKDLNDAVTGAKMTDDGRIALLSFLLDVQNARKDSAAADAVSARLDDLLAKNPNNPDAGKVISRRKLQGAQQALAAKQYDKAISEIQQNAASFEDPTQQAEALWTLAEAQYGKVGPKSSDKNALKESALAYMRVVANVNAPGKPHVADALFKTAEIEEQLGEAPQAQSLYLSIVSQFPSDPAAAKAKEAAAKIKLPSE